MNDFKRLYRTKDIWKADFLITALKDTGIACYHQQAYASGLELSPCTVGDPILADNIVYVAGDRESDAKEILEQMPFDRDEVNPPINFHEKVSPEMRSTVKWLYVALLGYPLVYGILYRLLIHFKRF